MTLPSLETNPAYQIYLTLGQYPILQVRIRRHMRRELFSAGVISQKEFENLVREQALNSQHIEGLIDPYGDEAGEDWKVRLKIVRDNLTDLFFANNLSMDVFEEIIRSVLAERISPPQELLLSFNPEQATADELFEQGKTILKMEPEMQSRFTYRLEEIKVVLLRRMFSDQLGFINIAKNWFSLDDLRKLRKRKIGKGKIGGKAAGMLLAHKILTGLHGEQLSHISIPESYYLGADTMYAFMSSNDLLPWSAQKYKTEDEIYAEYDQLKSDFENADFPPELLEQLEDLINSVGHKPLIVRSSGLLEDNFGTAFAGKYESYFCPNQGTFQENLNELILAIARVYASALSPDALLYRHRHGLQDYDERIAVLIQVVEGEQFGDYYMPQAAGVAFSRNLFRWSPQIRRDDGFVRLVWGMGTRAVDRVGNDYPRLVALSHPTLHAHSNPGSISRYSQKFVDLIDLEKNEFVTLPADEVLNRNYPDLRELVQIFKDGYLSDMRSNLLNEDDELVITFNRLLWKSNFAADMRLLLQTLEATYGWPVDVEFSISIDKGERGLPMVNITVLQCRPQSHLSDKKASLPGNLKSEEIIFSTSGVVPSGFVEDIKYVLFVPPKGYFSLPTARDRNDLTRAIGKINKELKEKYICVGPGRWGTVNPDLGVRISYADIHNTDALIELSGKGVGPDPEPSFGTHFFQDLMEAQIYPLAVNLDAEDMVFHKEFFFDGHDISETFLSEYGNIRQAIRLIDVGAVYPGKTMHLVMDDDAGKAVAYLK